MPKNIWTFGDPERTARNQWITRPRQAGRTLMPRARRLITRRRNASRPRVGRPTSTTARASRSLVGHPLRWRGRRPCAGRERAGPPGLSAGCQRPAHWPDFGPDVELGWPSLVGAGELPVQDSGPLMWFPETIVEPVLFCTTSGPAMVAPSIVT